MSTYEATKKAKVILTANVKRHDDGTLAYTVKMKESAPGIQSISEIHYYDRDGNCVDDDPLKALDHYTPEIAQQVLERHKEGMKKCSQP